MAGLGGRRIEARGFPSPGGAFDPMFGAPPTRRGPSVADRGMFDPLFSSFTSGPAWGSSSEWDPSLVINTMGTSQNQSDWDETANVTLTIPRPYKIEETSIARIADNTGVDMMIFEEDKAFETFHRTNKSVHDGTLVDDLGERPSYMGKEDGRVHHAKQRDNHQQVRPWSLSALNRYLVSESGRRRFGRENNARLLQHTFRFAGIQETTILDEQRTRDEVTVSLHIRGRVRFPNVWLAYGQVPAARSEVYLVPIYKRWMGMRNYKLPESDRLTHMPRTIIPEGKSQRQRREAADHGKIGLFSTPLDGSLQMPGEEPERPMVLADFRQSGGDADDGDDGPGVPPSAKRAKGIFGQRWTGEHYWQIVPIPAPGKHAPERAIYHNSNYQSIPWHIGTTTDHYGGDASAVHSNILHFKKIMKRAIFPDDDSDAYKADYYGSEDPNPRIELDLRPRMTPVNML